MGLHNKVYIGHVETINTKAKKNEKIVQSKVVALRLVGFDKNNFPKYQPLRKYGEYYKLNNVERLNGFVSDSKINKKIKSTGKQEVKVLRKVA